MKLKDLKNLLTKKYEEIASLKQVFAEAKEKRKKRKKKRLRKLTSEIYKKKISKKEEGIAGLRRNLGTSKKLIRGGSYTRTRRFVCQNFASSEFSRYTFFFFLVVMNNSDDLLLAGDKTTTQP